MDTLIKAMNDPENREKIKLVFVKYDKDKNGTLDKREFKMFLQDTIQVLGFETNLDEMLKDLMSVVDTNKDGVLSFDEFFECFQGLAPPPPGDFDELVRALSDPGNEEKVKKVFEKYDRDGNGYLDGKEFRNAMKDMTEILSFTGNWEEMATELMSVCSVTEEGKLQFKEFVELLNGLLN